MMNTNLETIEKNLEEHWKVFHALNNVDITIPILNLEIDNYQRLLLDLEELFEKYNKNGADSVIIQFNIISQYAELLKLLESIKGILNKYGLHINTEKQVILNDELIEILNVIKEYIQECEEYINIPLSRDLFDYLERYDKSIKKATEALLKCNINGADYILNFSKLKTEQIEMENKRKDFLSELYKRQDLDGLDL